MCIDCDLYEERQKVVILEEKNSSLNDVINDMASEIDRLARIKSFLWRVIVNQANKLVDASAEANGRIAELNAALDELSKENKTLMVSHDLFNERNYQLSMTVEILTSQLASEKLVNKKINAKLRHPSNGNVIKP